MKFLTKAVTPKNREKLPRFIVSSTNFQATHDSHRARWQSPGHHFPFPRGVLSLAGRSSREREKGRERGSALTPRRIISVGTDPNFWPARIFRPLRPTNFDQLTRKGMGSRHFPPVHVYIYIIYIPYMPSPVFHTPPPAGCPPAFTVYAVVCNARRGCYGCDQREIKFLTIETIPLRLAACLPACRARVFLQHRENHRRRTSWVHRSAASINPIPMRVNVHACVQWMRA